MAKLIGLLVIVLGIWAGVEIYTEGARSAFGGSLAPWLEGHELPQVADGKGGAVRRAGEAVTQAHILAEERRESLMARIEGETALQP